MGGTNERTVGGRGNVELGEFLRARRTRIDPREVGISQNSRRRVPGLRRGELAELACVSPDYYVRLEQGRHQTASPAVLNSLAQALRLSAGDRALLFALAKIVDPDPPEGVSTREEREVLHGMLAVFGSTPAVLFDEIGDILCANDAACFLFDVDFNALPEEQRNCIYWMLTSPRTRELYAGHWEEVAIQMIGKLKAETALHPHHVRAKMLIEILVQQSELFRAAWRQSETAFCVQGVLTLQHRVAGMVRVRSEAVTIQSSPGRVFYLLLPLDDIFEKAWRAHSRD